jgi:hypothetical protein
MLFLLLNPLSSLAQGNAKRFNEANQLFQQKRYDEVLSYLQEKSFLKQNHLKLLSLVPQAIIIKINWMRPK